MTSATCTASTGRSPGTSWSPPVRRADPRRARMAAMPQITLFTDDGPMDAYEAIPAEGIRGGIVVIQEAFGVNDHIESICDRLAAAGYHAVAPHLFHRA